MAKHSVSAIPFGKLHALYVQKAERKNRTRAEVDQVLCWLTGHDAAGLKRQVESDVDLETFLSQAPAFHPNATMVKGVVCGVRVEEIDDPFMRKVRIMDKLIDELAKGKAMEKILRS